MALANTPQETTASGLLSTRLVTTSCAHMARLLLPTGASLLNKVAKLGSPSVSAGRSRRIRATRITCKPRRMHSCLTMAEEELAMISGSADFLGINLYTSSLVYPEDLG